MLSLLLGRWGCVLSGIFTNQIGYQNGKFKHHQARAPDHVRDLSFRGLSSCVRRGLNMIFLKADERLKGKEMEGIRVLEMHRCVYIVLLRCCKQPVVPTEKESL